MEGQCIWVLRETNAKDIFSSYLLYLTFLGHIFLFLGILLLFLGVSLLFLDYSLIFQIYYTKLLVQIYSPCKSHCKTVLKQLPKYTTYKIYHEVVGANMYVFKHILRANRIEYILRANRIAKRC